MAGGLIEYVLRVKDDATGTLKRTSAGAEEASDKLDGMGRSAEGVEDAAGEADSVMQGLASAVEQFNPAAGAAIRVMGDMAGGLEAVARGGGALFTILGPVTVAVGAMGAAYVLLKKQLDDAAEAQDRATEAAERAMDVGRAVEIQKLREAAATGKITEAELERRLAAFTSASLFEDWIEAERQGLQELREEYSKLGGAERLQTLREIQAGAGPAIEMAGSGFDNEIEARQRQIDSLEKLEARMAAQQTTLDNLGVAQDKYAESIIKTNEARDRGSSSEPAAAARADAAAVQTAAALTIASIDDQIAAWDKLGAVRDKLTSDTMSEEEKILRQSMEYHAQILEIAEALEGVAGAEEQIAEYQQAATDWTVRRLEALQQMENVTGNIADNESRAMTAAQRGVSGAQAGTGGPAGVASMFGPIGALIGAVLDLLQQLGEGELGNKLEDINDSIIEGIRQLPAFLGEQGPELVNEFTEALVKALAENADDLVVKLTAGFFDAIAFFVGQFPRLLVEAIYQAVVEAWGAIRSGDAFTGGGGGRDVLSMFTGGLSELFMGGRDRGQMSIDRTGLYLLHRDEQVVSRNGRATQSASSGGGSGGGLSITVQGATGFSPEFADRLSDFFREQRARGVVF
jgi:hypothetical protein